MGANIPRTVGVVLAGGLSKRMGRPKAELRTPDGRSLLERAMASLTTVTSEVVVSLGKDNDSQGGVADRRKDLGPCAGLEASLLWAAARNSHWLLAFPVDLPFFPIHWLVHARDKAQSSGAMGAYLFARDGSEAQLCCALNVAVASSVTSYLDEGQRSVMGMHERIGSIAVCASDFSDYGAYPHAMLNLNRPEDWEQAFALLSAKESNAEA